MRPNGKWILVSVRACVRVAGGKGGTRLKSDAAPLSLFPFGLRRLSLRLLEEEASLSLLAKVSSSEFM